MLQLDITKIKIFKEGNPPIPIPIPELGASCEEATTSRDNCRVVCPVTTTITTTALVKTTTAASESSDNASLLNIVLAVVCGVLLLFLIIIVVMMCRQQRMTSAFYNKENTGRVDFNIKLKLLFFFKFARRLMNHSLYTIPFLD